MPLAHIASQIAHHPVRVECFVPDPKSEWATITPDLGVILIDPSLCTSVRRYLHGQRGPKEAFGILVLTHEAIHARGVINETETECEAYSTVLARWKPKGAFLRLVRKAHGVIRSVDGYHDHPCS